MRIRSHTFPAGFGYIEVIAVVAVIGLLCAIAVHHSTDLALSAEETALRTQTRTLNAAVKSYVNAGGSLAGLDTAQQVIDKLKTTAANGQQIAAFRGSFVDPRLQAVMQSDAEAEVGGALRVFWSGPEQQFVTAVNGLKGVKGFVLNEEAAPESPITENRATNWQLAQSKENLSGVWVWDYDESPIAATVGGVPTAPTLDPGDNPGGPNTYSNRVQLTPPTYSVPTGTYPLPNYPMSLTLADTNDAGSQLYYSLNGSDWMIYTGPVPVAPGGQLASFAVSTDISRYYDSFSVVEEYESNTIQLSAPVMSASAAQFHPLHSSTVTVALGHDNDPVHAKIVYSIGEGGAWYDYTEPLELNIDHFITGTSIVAKSAATAWPEYYLESDAVSMSLPAVSITLDPPVIAASAAQLIYPVILETITLDILNPNVVGFSKTIYSIDGGTTWGDFTGQLTFTSDEFPQGVSILAQTIAVVHEGNILSDDPVEQGIEAWARPQLEPPLITEPGNYNSIYMDPQGSVPAGFQIYYSLDGTDPGDNGLGKPVAGTLYAGDFPLDSWLCENFDIVARVYGPAGSEEYYIPSSATTFVKTSKRSRNPGYAVVCDFRDAGFCDYGWFVLGTTTVSGSDNTIVDLGIGPAVVFTANSVSPHTAPTDTDPSAVLLNVTNPVWKSMSSNLTNALNLNLTAQALTPTQSFDRIINSTTIQATAPDGLNVISVNEIDMSASNDNLTLQGSAGDYFIINVNSKFKLAGGATFALDGVSPSHVLFNVKTGVDVDLTGNSLIMNATVLAPTNRVKMGGSAQVNGTMISGSFSSIGGSAIVNHLSTFGCE